MNAPLYSDPRVVRQLASEIAVLARELDAPVRLMEVCGTHTHAIAEAGLRRLLPEAIGLRSGPGCPVCVTPVDIVDRAVALAHSPAVRVATFGDLLRVPGSTTRLEDARAAGGRVAVIYSPRDALSLARAHPEETVVLVAIGFETTAPTVAAALAEAEASGVENLEILCALKTMPAALATLAGAPDVAVDGFLLPGHVSVITGADAFGFLPSDLGRPAAVAGFAPADVLRAIRALVQQRLSGSCLLENCYDRVVTAEGNGPALDLLARMFEPVTATWRGLGALPGSGLALRPELAHRDAGRRSLALPAPVEPPDCRCGQVLRGALDPPGCPLFAKRCTPDRPVGACMVSGEGACAAWYRYRPVDREDPRRIRP